MGATATAKQASDNLSVLEGNYQPPMPPGVHSIEDKMGPAGPSELTGLAFDQELALSPAVQMKRKGFPDCQLSFLEGDRGAVALYRTRQAGLRTFRGIGVDDTLERIRQAYPEGRVASMPLGKGMLVVYPIHALAFRLQPDNRIFEWGLLLSW